MEMITPTTFAERLHAGETLLVLDIRPDEEFDEWHIPGSVQLDIYDQLTADPASADEVLATLPNDNEIVTVCTAGVVSQRARDRLLALGYDAMALENGLRGWSTVHLAAPIDVDIDGTVYQVTRPGKGCLSYVLVSDGEAAVFDPSHYHHEYESILDSADAKLRGIFDTHVHADHLSGGHALAAKWNVPYYLHPADAIEIAVEPIADGQQISIGSIDIRVIHTPGHSPGSVTYALGTEALLTGDTLFHRSVGRVELGIEAALEDTNVRENAETLFESLRRIRAVDGDPLVLPAHDPGTPFPPVVERLQSVAKQNQDLNKSREPFIDDIVDDVPDHPPNFLAVKRSNSGLITIDEENLRTIELGPNRCAAE